MSARDELKRTQDLETAELLRDLASFLQAMADALEEQDDILGVLASTGMANNLPALPTHIRHIFTDLLTDEAAISYRADLAYLSANKEKVASPE